MTVFASAFHEPVIYDLHGTMSPGARQRATVRQNV
jgi:hypothetical protein